MSERTSALRAALEDGIDTLEKCRVYIAHLEQLLKDSVSRGVAQDRPVYREIALERAGQHAKWGEQNHPDVPVARNFHDGVWSSGAQLGIPEEDRAKRACQEAAKAGSVTWGHILVEEVAEMVDAATEAHRRHELIQVAAVVVAWIEAIDRRNNR